MACGAHAQEAQTGQGEELLVCSNPLAALSVDVEGFENAPQGNVSTVSSVTFPVKPGITSEIACESYLRS